MAGQIPLESKYYPSDFQVTTVVIDKASTGQFFWVMYAERDMIVDSVMVYVGDAPTADELLKVVRVSDSALPVYAGTGTTTVMTDELSIPLAGSYPLRVQTGTSAWRFVDNAQLVPTENVVPAGSTLWIAFGSVLAGIDTCAVQIRWRSQL